MTVYWCDYLLVYCTHIRAKKNPRAEFYVGIIIFNMILVSVLCSAPWHALYWKCLAMSIMVRSSLVCFIYIYTHISWCIYYIYISLQMRVYEMRWERYIRSIVGWLVGWFVWLMLLCISTFSERLLLSNNAEMLDECEHQKVLLE